MKKKIRPQEFEIQKEKIIMASENYDLIVIGGGPGGYVAAIRARQLGLKTALIEAQHLGGVCLNWGCIPTKALLKTAEIYRHIHEARDFGLEVTSLKVNWPRVIERSREIATRLSKGIQGLMKKNKVDVFEGWGKIAKKSGSEFTVEVAQNGKTSHTLKATKVILASGAKARDLPHIAVDGQNIWSAKEAMIAEKKPDSLLVIGSGAIGVEFASFYNTFGTKVTIVEIQDRILPVEDREVSQHMQKILTNLGIQIHTNTQIQSVKNSGRSLEAILEMKGEKPQTAHFEKILLAVGIVGNTENLGLEKTKAKVEKGQILTNAVCETHEPGLYAIGDVAGAPWLAHKASHEGVIAVEHIAGKHPHSIDKNNIPGCTYSYPQVASVGLTEAQAKEQNLPIKIGKFPFVGNGKALASGESEGFIKVIFHEKTGELLGAHMVGDGVTELIHGYTLAKSSELTEQEIINTVYPHPTMSEMMHEAVLDAYKRVIHM